MKKWILLMSFCASLLPMLAQVSVEASIAPIEILVGQQSNVTLKVTMKEGANAAFPVFRPTEMLIPGIEVLASTELGVHALADGLVERTVVYTLTSFEDTLYYLPPFVVQVDGKQYESKSLALKVATIDVDTLHTENFFGPKTVQDNPFMWSDWSGLFWISVVMLLLMSLGYYLYLRLRDNKPIIKRISIIKRMLPHQKAMKEIEQIKASNLASADDVKEYYTQLTDTLRRYIEERYGFSAMEMTSSEIIDRLMKTDDQQSLNELRQLFTTADLVKFAKYSTLINENDANLVSAIDFINQTKIDTPPQEEAQKPQLTEEEMRSQKTRHVLQGVIFGIAIISLALLVYVVYGVYLLLI